MPSFRSYPALAVLSTVDLRGKVLAVCCVIREMVVDVLSCVQGDKQE